MVFQWTYHKWIDDPKHPAQKLDANSILLTERNVSIPPQTVQGLVTYAEMSYVACRILMLASRSTTLPALYFAGQTVEKYLKAVWLEKAGTKRKTGHKIAKLACRIAQRFPELAEFGDPEFLKVCERLEPFDEAGRYPDNAIKQWGVHLHLLTFLDTFVTHCRQITGSPTQLNPIQQIATQDGNKIMKAAITAIRERNREFNSLAEL